MQAAVSGLVAPLLPRVLCKVVVEYLWFTRADLLTSPPGTAGSLRRLYESGEPLVTEATLIVAEIYIEQASRRSKEVWYSKKRRSSNSPPRAPRIRPPVSARRAGATGAEDAGRPREIDNRRERPAVGVRGCLRSSPQCNVKT